MPRKISTFVLTAVVFVSLNVIGFAESKTLMTRHTRDEVTSHIAPLVGHLSSAQKLDLVLMLQHRNQSELDQFLKDVNDSSSAVYRHFLSVDQFTEKYGPSVEDYESVKAWARQNGLEVKGNSRNRMIVRVNGSVDSIEKALHVSIGLYQHPTENRIFFAVDREPTPEMSVRLWAIGGLDNFSRPVPAYSKRDANSENADIVIGNATIGSGPGNSFLGSDIRAAYYSSGGGTLNGAGQTLGIFEFVGTDLADLTTYYTNVGQTNNVPITLLSVDGQSINCTDNSQGGFCDDTEQTIDMTQALGMAPGLTGLTMFIGKGALAGQTLDDVGILNAMATTTPLASTLSCSWLWRPQDSSTDDPIFQEFQAQGQNFFVAAGDSAKWTSGGFSFPAEDDYTVSVGGTDLTTSSAGGPWASETAWSSSGGGISPDKFAIPSWQVSAAAGCTSCSQVDRNGPDVAMNANYTYYVCADQTKCSENLYGGTSFAAPAWAGYIALANQQAVTNGQPVLGYLNPLIYGIYATSSYDTDFHDITSGSNGFSATVGYDLVTGLGSPNGANLINALAGAQPDFSMATAPHAIAVAPGGAGHLGVSTTVSGGFDSVITLSASGQPAGVQIKFNPTSITGAGRAAVQVRVATTTAAGTYTITITGSGGGKTHTATFTLKVS